MFSRKWPSPPTPGNFGEVSKRLSSSLLSIASDRCWNLMNRARYSTVYAIPQQGSLTSGRVIAEEDEATNIPALSDISQRKGPLDFDEALRLEGSRVAQNCISSLNDSDIQNQLPAWIRALGLAEYDRSVSIPILMSPKSAISERITGSCYPNGCCHLNQKFLRHPPSPWLDIENSP